MQCVIARVRTEHNDSALVFEGALRLQLRLPVQLRVLATGCAARCRWMHRRPQHKDHSTKLPYQYPLHYHHILIISTVYY